MASRNCPASTVSLLIALAIVSSASPAVHRHAMPEPATAPAAATQPTLNFELERGHLIVVRGTIGGAAVKLLLDTGTYRTVIDSRIAGDWPGTPDRMDVFGQIVPTRRVNLPSLQLGPLHVAGLQVLAADMWGLRERLGTQADGIVGLDVLRGRCLIVDYATKRLSFACASAWTASVAGVADSPYVVAVATIDAREYRLLVDSGSDAIAIFERLAGPHLARGHEGEVRADTLVGTVRLRRFVAASVRLGAISLGSQPVLVIPGGDAESHPGFDGVLGLRHVAPRVQLDLERMAISWNR